MDSRMLACVVAALSTGVSAASGAFVTVDLSMQVNADIRTYTAGDNYPVGGSIADFGGVPFQTTLQDANDSSFGVIQLPVTEQPSSFSLAVEIGGAATLFTLANSAFGQFGALNGTLEVFGTNGAYASFDLIQGDNLRDHFNGVYNNTASNPTNFATDFGGGARLDRQRFDLPAVFAGETVNELRFSGTGSSATGAAFLAGATFELIPSPGAASVAMLAGMAGLRRRRA